MYSSVILCNFVKLGQVLKLAFLIGIHRNKEINTNLTVSLNEKDGNGPFHMLRPLARFC